MLLAVIGFTACDSDSIEGLKGEFNDITFCNFSQASVQPTQKLGKGIKALNTQFSDASGNSLILTFGSNKGPLTFIVGEDDLATIDLAGNTGSGLFNFTFISLAE